VEGKGERERESESTGAASAGFDDLAASLLEGVDGHEEVLFRVLPAHRVDWRIVLHEQ
jgi:hypothetical protein